ncbi:beta-sandwich lipoprotein [Nocardia asteroides]|uniref:beta-sandwich lipoprotein n=1 Tax=Nocardia asteroides TaxID=1824 RepID=UPI003667E520
MGKKLIAAVAALFAGTVAATGCSSDADVVSKNLSKESDQFKIDRRVVFFNGITDKYLLSIEGKCSIKDENNQLEVTCKTGDDEYKKHFLGLSDNVSYFVEQLEGANVSPYHYKVIFKPETIIADVDHP